MILQNSFSTNGNGVDAGLAGGAGASDGFAAGQDLFFYTGAAAQTFNLNALSGETFTFNGSIADDSVDSIPSGQSFTPGSGAGLSIQKTGTGSIVFNGINTYAGSTDIVEGRMTLSGSILNAVSVGGSGIFGGSGTVFGSVSVANQGLIDLTGLEHTTYGSLDLGSGAIYRVAIDASGSSSSIAISGSGNAAIDPNAVLQIDVLPGSYTVGQTFTIMTAQSGVISAPFGHIAVLNSNLQFSNSLDSSSKTLLLTLLSGFSSALLNNLTGNNRIVADYLNSLSGFSSIQPLLLQLSELSNDQLAAAIETIDPARNAFAAFALQNAMFAFSSMVNERLGSRRFIQLPKKLKEAVALSHDLSGLLVDSAEFAPESRQQAKDQNHRYGVWGAGFGQFIHEHAQDQTPAFHINTGGLAVGFDAFNFEYAVVGICAGYAGMEIPQKNGFGSQWVNDYVFSLYSSFFISHFFLDSALWAGYQQIESKRNIFFPGYNATVRSHSQGGQLTPHLGFGYDLVLDAGAIEPFAQFDWAIDWNGGFTEQGGTPLAMDQRSQTSSMLRSEVGIASYQTCKMGDAGLFVIKGKLSYVNKTPFQTGRVTAAIVGAPGSFTVESFSSQNLAAPGIEFFYKDGNGIFCSATYEGEFGSGYSLNSAYLKLGLEF